MRQDQTPNKRGKKAQAQDNATSLAASLSILASELHQVHPANIIQGTKALAAFAAAQMQDESYTSGDGTHSETEELAVTILAVLRGSHGAEFNGVLPMYGKLLDTVNTLCFAASQEGKPEEIDPAEQACAELDRIELNLGVDSDKVAHLNPVAAYLFDVANSPNWIGIIQQYKHKVPARITKGFVLPEAAAICAAILVALLVWNLTVDHFALWQLLAAVALIAGVCQLCRLGCKRAQLQTPVLKADS